MREYITETFIKNYSKESIKNYNQDLIINRFFDTLKSSEIIKNIKEPKRFHFYKHKNTKSKDYDKWINNFTNMNSVNQKLYNNISEYTSHIDITGLNGKTTHVKIIANNNNSKISEHRLDSFVNVSMCMHESLYNLQSTRSTVPIYNHGVSVDCIPQNCFKYNLSHRSFYNIIFMEKLDGNILEIVNETDKIKKNIMIKVFEKYLLIRKSIKGFYHNNFICENILFRKMSKTDYEIYFTGFCYSEINYNRKDFYKDINTFIDDFVKHFNIKRPNNDYIKSIFCFEKVSKTF